MHLMTSPETPPTAHETGAIYIANVRIQLPPLAEVQAAHDALQKFDSHWSQQYSSPDEDAPGIAAAITAPTGDTIDTYDQSQVAYYRPGAPYVLLQTYVGDNNQNFDSLFKDGVDDGTFGLHTSYVNESALYVVPIEACGATEPVPSTAVLCLGKEAVEHSMRPDESQVYALFLAAQIALRDQIIPAAA